MSRRVALATAAARLALALETLRRAHAELLLAFGRRSGGGEAGREVREMIVGLERELAVWNRGAKVLVPVGTAP